MDGPAGIRKHCEIRPGIFSLSGYEPSPEERLEERLMLAITPLAGIPIPQYNEYVCGLWNAGDVAKEARGYGIGITARIALHQAPLVVIEPEDQVDDMIAFLAENARMGPGYDGYVIAARGTPAEFGYNLAHFLAEFGVADIEVFGRYDEPVRQYLDNLPLVNIRGIDTQLRCEQ